MESLSFEVVLTGLPEKVAASKDEVGIEARASCLPSSTLQSHREQSLV